LATHTVLASGKLAMLLTVWVGAAYGQVIPSSAADPLRAAPMEAVVNGAKAGTWLFIESAGVFYAPAEAFNEWRIRLPSAAQPIEFKDQKFWPVAAVTGVKIDKDTVNQRLNVAFPPEGFPATLLTNDASKRPAISPVLTSVFLNYDLNYITTSQRNAPTSRDMGLLYEVGVSSDMGVFTSSAVGRNLIRNQAVGATPRFQRLQTTFTKDFPERNHTLRLGDSTTRAGTLGRNVYFGGIQFGTNYGLTPGMWTQPLPVLNGLSAAPSTVELYVNDVLRQTSNVPPGPFVVDNFPILTGNGQARMVVRDILGRETVVTQPFFTHNRLLAKDLNDWSVEFGRLRRNLGLASNNYGATFASGLWRRGYSDTLTLDSHVEATSGLYGAGLGLSTALPWQLLGRAALQVSREQTLGSGSQWLLGIDHPGERSSLQLELQGAAPRFRQLGLDTSAALAKYQTAVNWNYRFAGDVASVGLGYASIRQHDATRLDTLSASLAVRLGESSTLNFTASKSRSNTNGSALGVTLVIPFESNRIFTASASRNNDQRDSYVSVSQNYNQGTGVGWRALAGQQQQSRAEGGVTYQGHYGLVSSDISTSPLQTALRFGARGSLVIADGNLFATRYLDQGFAVAEVTGHSDIAIGLGGSSLARTNKQGRALIPQLSSYQTNSVRLDLDELPFGVEIDSIEQSVVPAWRSAVKVTFPVRSGRGALLKIVLDDAEPAPAGATVSIEGSSQEFYVARRGESFVTGLQAANRLLLKWKDRQCQFDLKLPHENKDEIPRLGPLVCKGMTR
jgi:outer membrane usher protein